MDTKAEVLEACGGFLVAPSMSPPVMERVASNLIDRYTEPWRRHHIIAHLGDMATYLLPRASELNNPRIIFWMKLGHDAILLPELFHPKLPKGLNERRSAQLTMELLKPYLPDGEVEEIGDGILRTADHKYGGDNPDLADF